jgi:hypothetical protein
MRLATLALTLWFVSHTPAQAQKADDDAERLEIRVYRVGDLLLPPRNYPFAADSLPTTGMSRASATPDARFFGGAMGGQGGGGFGGGGGLFQVKDQTPTTPPHVLPQVGGGGGWSEAVGGAVGMGGLGFADFAEPRIDAAMDELLEVITAVVEPNSWDTMGGEATIQPLRGMLIVRQTAKAHEQIQVLLEQIHTEGGAVTTLTVQAHWLFLTPEQQAALTDGQGEAPPSPLVLDRQQWLRLRNEAKGLRAALTCFSGQTVHLASGSRRTVKIGVVPVVGGATAAYQPTTVIPNIGVVLQITPTLSHDAESATLDVQTALTHWQGPDQPAVAGSEAEVDRVHMPTQQFATTLRAPLNKPVLAGGVSLVEQGDNPAQVCLVLEVAAAKANK